MPQLPPEIMLEIVSYLPDGDMNTPKYVSNFVLGASVLERSDALRALSQTCRAWRALFWPMLWERLEAGALKDGTGAWYRVLAEAVIKKFDEIASRPDIATRIREMRIVVSRYEISRVLRAITKVLRACKNLKTLNVHWTQGEPAGAFSVAFKNQIFPSVETIVLPSNAYYFLRACPNVTKVHCCAGDGSQIVSAIAADRKKVQVLTGIHVYEILVERIARVAPNLREIRLSNNAPDQSLALLAHLKHLRLVETGPAFGMAAIRSEPAMEKSLQILKGVLRGKSGATIIIRHRHVRYDSTDGKEWTESAIE